MKLSKNELVNLGKSEIQEFFHGCNVFLTGGTGFLGILILEKLLRSCNKINKIYVLIRKKKGKTTEKRFLKLFEPVIFDGLKKANPKIFNKVVLMEGDCLLPNLGLNKENQERLINEVNFVFHSAATVRFDEKIRTAAYTNVRATRDLLVLSKSIKNLKSFVYISTICSYCPQFAYTSKVCNSGKAFKEKFYYPAVTDDKLLTVVNALNDDILEKITPILIGNWPNTYTFTKSVAEQVIRDYGKRLPIAMVRPGIVTSTAKEPTPGWINNLYGPVGSMTGAGLGLIHAVLCDGSKILDIVPADYTVNCAIAAAWDIGRDKNDNIFQENMLSGYQENEANSDRSNTKIYNYVSCIQNPITLNEFTDLGKKHGCKIPSVLMIWYPFVFYTTLVFWYKILSFLLHTVPAYVADFFAYCLGKEPMLVKGYTKIHKFQKTLSYFALRQWDVCNTNTRKLWMKLNNEDRRLFEFDIKAIDWDDYFAAFTIGARIYVAKDPMDTVPEGRKKYLTLKIIHYIFVLFLLLCVFKLLILF